MRIAPARRVAFRVIRRVLEEGAFADRALHAEAADLDARDRALAMALAYGTVQRRRTLDALIDQFSRRPAERLDAPVRVALELGAYQLTLMDGVPAHAAVHESVTLVRSAGVSSSAGLVNAVLRRIAGQGRDLIAAMDDDTPEHAAVLHSVPDWLAAMWFEELGAGPARALLSAVNRAPESALRLNTLRPGAPELAWHPAPELPEGRVLDAPVDLFGTDAWREGQLMPQSRASMLVSRALDPQPGERVLDLCAAPGAKTTHLSALMEARGELVAVEVHPGRAAALERTCARMGAANVEVLTVDGRALPAGLEPFDRVLVDPPCSGLGTLQSRPDLRWQERRGRREELTDRQLGLLGSGAAATRPGGRLVYSVCTISQAESAGVVDAFLASAPGWRLESLRTTTPSVDGTDGFAIAHLQAPG